MTTAELTNQAIKILTDRGCNVWRQAQTPFKRRSGTVKKGQPDIIGFQASTGLFVGCEVKNMGDILSDEQIAFLSRLHASGGIALIARHGKDNVELISFSELTNYDMRNR